MGSVDTKLCHGWNAVPGMYQLRKTNMCHFYGGKVRESNLGQIVAQDVLHFVRMICDVLKSKLLGLVLAEKTILNDGLGSALPRVFQALIVQIRSSTDRPSLAKVVQWLESVEIAAVFWKTKVFVDSIISISNQR